MAQFGSEPVNERYRNRLTRPACFATSRAMPSVRARRRKRSKPADPPPPPKRSRQARNGLVVFFNFLMSMLVLDRRWAFSPASISASCASRSRGRCRPPRTVVVKEGSSLARIAEQLEASGVIDSELLFRIGVRGYGVAGNLKPGEYAFTPGMSMYDVMETIRTGKGILYKITFPEGLTSYQIVEKLKQDPILTGDLPAEIPPEGTLLPDTYPYQRGATRAGNSRAHAPRP